MYVNIVVHRFSFRISRNQNLRKAFVSCMRMLKRINKAGDFRMFFFTNVVFSACAGMERLQFALERIGIWRREGPADHTEQALET